MFYDYEHGTFYYIISTLVAIRIAMMVGYPIFRLAGVDSVKDKSKKWPICCVCATFGVSVHIILAAFLTDNLHSSDYPLALVWIQIWVALLAMGCLIIAEGIAIAVAFVEKRHRADAAAVMEQEDNGESQME